MATMNGEQRDQLHRDGYMLLRQAIPHEWLNELRDTFDAGVIPLHEWPVPRETSIRYSLLDLNDMVQAVCRLPTLLEVVGELIGESFFHAQVEGREPKPGCGHQRLHRDMSAQRPGDSVSAIVYFDDYGPDNGSTRLIPGTHRPSQDDAPFNPNDESRTIQLTGQAGDILVFDVDLVHAGSLNKGGARRRSLLTSYFAAPLHPMMTRTAHLRNVRMRTDDRFSEAGKLLPTAQAPH